MRGLLASRRRFADDAIVGCDVATRSAQASDEADLHRITATRQHNGNRRNRRADRPGPARSIVTRALAIFWGENAASGVGEPSSHFSAVLPSGGCACGAAVSCSPFADFLLRTGTERAVTISQPVLVNLAR